MLVLSFYVIANSVILDVIWLLCLGDFNLGLKTNTNNQHTWVIIKETGDEQKVNHNYK